MELDVGTLQNIIDNDSNAIKERILLAKYYEKNDNNLKALSLIQEVLKKDSKNKNALLIKKSIETKERVRTIFREAGLSFPITSLEAEKRLDSYYATKNYQFYSNLYQALVSTNTKLEDTYHIKAAYIYLFDTRYDESKKALAELKQDNNIDATKIRADICYYTGKYKCSTKLYEKLYNSLYDIKIAIKLINSYLYLNQTEKAQRLYNFVHRKYPNNIELQKLGKKVEISKNKYLKNIQNRYLKNKNYDTLLTYANALFTTGKKSEAIELIHEYNKEKMTKKSLILEAKYLTWVGQTDKALEILKYDKLNSDLDAKLILGQIYSWNQQYDKAKENLNKVIQESKDKEQVYNAEKAMAYIYLWNKKEQDAKKLFIKLQKEKPLDQEVKEAIMELNHDYNGLIEIYKKRTSLNDIKRLAELYQLNKEPKKAIKCLDDYLNKQPTDLEGTKALALLLIDNKDYYKGFGYLEYYAAQKQTLKSSILLAKNYYWQGFSREAIDVLEKLPKKDLNNKEVLKLKANILKVAPRFTTNNTGITTAKYFDDLGEKQLFLADTLYFNTHYKASLEYYKSYLGTHPDDYDARYRYAFALENAKQYAKAEGEFYLMFAKKDNDELRYHYAYNMMMNGKTKKSEKLFLQLKDSVYKKVDVKINQFLDSWKTSWESLKFQKYATHYSDSFLKNEIWSFRKQDNFSKLSYIKVGIYDPLYKKIGKNKYKIKFYQEYRTDKNSDKGYKVLEIKCDTNKTECKITKEEWTAGEYKKELQLLPYIDKSLKQNKYLKEHPLALNTKKKSLCLNNTDTMIYT